MQFSMSALPREESSANTRMNTTAVPILSANASHAFMPERSASE